MRLLIIKNYKIHYHFSKIFSISSPIKERPKTKKNIANPGNKYPKLNQYGEINEVVNN